MKRQRVFSGAGWEEAVGYCRAIRVGDLVFVAGTAPVAPGGGLVAPGDPYLQARRCLEIITAALAEAGASPADVVRTRMFVADASRWSEIGRAHREVFGAHPPVATLIEVKGFVDPGMTVEIEADAVVAPRARARRKAKPVARKRATPRSVGVRRRR